MHCTWEMSKEFYDRTSWQWGGLMTIFYALWEDDLLSHQSTGQALSVPQYLLGTHKNITEESILKTHSI